MPVPLCGGFLEYRDWRDFFREFATQDTVLAVATTYRGVILT
jgi:hypothetical protein